MVRENLSEQSDIVTVTGTTGTLLNQQLPNAQANTQSANPAPTNGVIFESEVMSMDMDMGNPHDPDSPKFIEHADLMRLVEHDDATHVAVNDGAWFDAATWENGEIPGDDARVVIQDGVSVTYAGVSDARLFTVRVDGELDFATDVDSTIVFDTMVISRIGELTIGTEETPVEDGVQVNLIVANNGDIDVTWDPGLLSRGLIAHGETEMHGQEKTTHLKVETDPMAGDTALTLSEIPTNWNVGDTIVLAGTSYAGHSWNGSEVEYKGTEDEVLTITEINGNQVSFATPLVYDHATPRADLKTSVVNYTRNIRIETEDAETAAVHERGHVMFMHSDDVDVRYVEFHELGRTDKSERATNVYDLDTVESTSNVQGRYSVHFHRTGFNAEDEPALLLGNAVFGSPGWGFVHHDSHAHVQDNATFNTFGAGFVAETGNETGAWIGNIAIKAEGINTISKNGANVAAFDLAGNGAGFWFQGRMVESHDNIAASVNHGFTYMVRGSGVIAIEPEQFDLPEALGRLSRGIDDAPIVNVTNNEAFATSMGLEIIKANPNQGHDVRSVIEGFTAWEVQTGANIEYTSHYTLIDFDLIGMTGRPQDYRSARQGFSAGTNTTDMVMVDFKVEGFGQGINLEKNFTNDVPSDLTGYTNYILINPQFANNTNDLIDYEEGVDRILTWDDIEEGRFDITLDHSFTYSGAYNTPTGRRVDIDGTKTDSIGDIRIAAGTDNYDIRFGEVLSTLNEVGYYADADGNNYFILESYYSDRVTGEVFKFGNFVLIDEDVALGNQYFSYSDATLIGMIDLESEAPETNDEAYLSLYEQDLVIEVLANDSDSDGDTTTLDGITQPTDGEVYANEDGTITYRPDFGFSGVDTFKYWVTDGNANYTEATVTIRVAAEGEDLPSTQDALEAGDVGATLDLRQHGSETGLRITALNKNSTTVGELTGLGDFDIGNGAMNRAVYAVTIEGLTPVLLPGETASTKLSVSAVASQFGVDTALANGDVFWNATSITGTDFDDFFVGGRNQDTVRGMGGDDKILGKDGRDFLSGQGGDDLIKGGRGHDQLRGGDGDDRLDGNSGNDDLRGLGDNDRLYGGTGRDRLAGGDGDDILNGGNNDDSLHGGDGADILRGGRGDDVLNGNAGDDILDGRQDNDTLRGGDGFDDYIFGSQFGDDVIVDFNISSNEEDINLTAVSDIDSFADLMSNHVTQDGADTVITSTEGTITLTGIDSSDLESGDFIF